MIERSTTVQVKPTPYELANEFCEMDADQQTLFLTFISDMASNWDRPFEFQVQAIVDSKNFNCGANEVMKIFGEYAK